MNEQNHKGLDSIDQLNYEQRQAESVLAQMLNADPTNLKLQAATELVRRGADAGAVVITILEQQHKNNG